MNLEGLRAALALETLDGNRTFLKDEDLQAAMASVSDEDIEQALSDIMAYRGPENMPADPLDVVRLVDAISFLHGNVVRARGWEIIGIPPKRARGMLSARQEELNWPLFFTCKQYGLGLAT